MGAKRGAYRHKSTETTGNRRKDLLREETGLTTAEWREMNRALDSYLGTVTTKAPKRTPKRHRPAFVRWRITYSGPSLPLAMLAALASRAVERAIAEGKATKPDKEIWRDPWEAIE